MKKHLIHIIEGARQVLVLMPTDSYVRPTRSGFSADAKALKDDARRVGRDLRTTLSSYQYGK